MTTEEKIRHLYNLPMNKNFGYIKSEIAKLEARLDIYLPKKLKNYYLTLGKHKNINYSHNRLLRPNNEINFSDDKYLVFYEENQVVAYWGIKQTDLQLDNPPVYGNYAPGEEDGDWHLETKTTEDFFLLMAIYNGTLGGLKYNANSLEQLKTETVNYIQNGWKEIREISWEKQKIYTNNYSEVLSLSFDENKNCNAIFIGTSNKKQFDNLLEIIDVEWSYICSEDE